MAPLPLQLPRLSDEQLKTVTTADVKEAVAELPHFNSKRVDLCSSLPLEFAPNL